MSKRANCAYLTPTALLDICQDMATEHAQILGIGLGDLYEKGLIWAVVRQRFDIVSQPKPHQEVVVRTWPYAPSRAGMKRDYSLHAQDGTLLAKGTSDWVILDVVNKGFVSALDVYQGPTDFLEDRMYEGKLRKLKDFETTEEPALVVTPQFTDIDSNMHVNNARYTNYVANALEQGPDLGVLSIQIDYRKELTLGEPVALYSMEDEAGTHVKGLNPEGDISFSCLLTRG